MCVTRPSLLGECMCTKTAESFFGKADFCSSEKVHRIGLHENLQISGRPEQIYGTLVSYIAPFGAHASGSDSLSHLDGSIRESSRNPSSRRKTYLWDASAKTRKQCVIRRRLHELDRIDGLGIPGSGDR